MPTLNRSKPYGDVLGQAEEYPGARFYQSGAYFDAHGAYIGGGNAAAEIDDKDAEIEQLRAELEKLRGMVEGGNDGGSYVPPPDDSANVPPPFGLTEQQYSGLLELGIDLISFSKAEAKRELFAYAQGHAIDGATSKTDIPALADLILAA